MKNVKEQKQNDNGEVVDMKSGQRIKIPKNSGKAWLTLFYCLRRSLSASVLLIWTSHAVPMRCCGRINMTV